MSETNPEPNQEKDMQFSSAEQAYHASSSANLKMEAQVDQAGKLYDTNQPPRRDGLLGKLGFKRKA